MGLESQLGDAGLGDTALRHIFVGDNTLEYVPFRSDFGPVNIAKVHRFCRILAGKLQVRQVYTTRSYCLTNFHNDKLFFLKMRPRFLSCSARLAHSDACVFLCIHTYIFIYIHRLSTGA